MKMTDDEIVVAVERVISQSTSFIESKLSSERRDVWKYYRGELPLPTHAGNSKYNSMDVYDSVDAMRAQLFEAFSAHEKIVQFAPQTSKDAEGADEATEFCSWAFFRQNKGHKVLYDTLTDGLMSRYGIAKVWVEETSGDSVKFESLTEDELAATLEEDGVEPDEESLQPDDQGLYSGTARKKGSKKIRIAAVPLEEIYVSPNAPCIEDADLIHHTRVTKSWLLRQGYSKRIVNEVEEAREYLGEDTEKAERFAPFQGHWRLNQEANPERLYVNLYECYMELDCEGKGLTELYFIRMAGRTLLEKSVIKRKPFAFFVPLPTPHTPFGENFAKFVIPTQRARSVLIRGIIDHTVMTNNPRMLVMNGTLMNPSELMDNRLGGLVNVRRVDGILPVPQSPLNPFVFQAIGLLDEDKEETTGISKLSQGMNKDAISKQNSQGMVEGLISNSQIRQKMVARQFGEFLKSLWLLIYDTALEQLDQEYMIQVTGEWKPVDPSRWTERTAVTVDLCLSQSEASQEAMKMIAIDQYLGADPRLADQYGAAQRYEILKKVLKKNGFPNPEAVLLPPDKVPPKEPDPVKVLQLEALKAEVKLANAQADAAEAKAKMEPVKVQGELALDADRLALDEKKATHEAAMSLMEMKMAKEAPEGPNKRTVIAPDT